MELEKVAPHVELYQNQFANANHVLIVGGGAIGAEVAGEIKDKWPVRHYLLSSPGFLLTLFYRKRK
jgi:NADH dehydrogenase FAD-containing subunit